MWVVTCWRLVMDNRFNPLRFIPDPSLQMYFTLFVATFYMGWYGYDIVTSIAIHIAVIIPIAFTNAVFLDAERNGDKWLKEWKKDE